MQEGTYVPAYNLLFLFYNLAYSYSVAIKPLPSISYIYIVLLSPTPYIYFSSSLYILFSLNLSSVLDLYRTCNLTKRWRRTSKLTHTHLPLKTIIFPTPKT